MSVTIVGIDTFIEGLGAASEMLKGAVEKLTMDAALHVRRLAQGKVPKRTSVLAQSITSTPIAYGAMTEVGEKYGIWVEEGTGLYDPDGPHLIFPKTAKALVWSEGGVRYGARWTRGMHPQPYFEPAVNETLPYFDEQIGLMADRLLEVAAA